MNPEQLKQAIIQKAKELQIDKIGFASADPFIELRERLVRHRKNGYESGFEEPDLDKRTQPELSLRNAKTMIAIALAYPSKLKPAPRSKPGAYRGIFCRASWGEDYHQVLRKKLSALEAFIQEKVPHAQTKSMVDTGPLSDRAVAERAGIGWSGKNTSILTEEFGSWVYLGEMITDLYLPPDQPVTEGCGDCNLCIEACPTGALVGPGQLNAQSCIAFLTQTKGWIPMKYRKKLGNRLYGCDTCQIVCPKNKGKHFAHHEEFRPDPEKVKPLLTPLLKMSNRSFQETFGKMAGSWRGKKPIQRNAIIALGHFRDASAVPDLIQLLHNDPRPVIRGTVAWALAEIGHSDGKQAIVEQLEKEQDPEVIEECQQALAKFKSKIT